MDKPKTYSKFKAFSSCWQYWQVTYPQIHTDNTYSAESWNGKWNWTLVLVREFHRQHVYQTDSSRHNSLQIQFSTKSGFFLRISTFLHHYIKYFIWKLQQERQQFSCKSKLEWVSEWVSSVLRPLQHSIGYMGDGIYRSKDPTNSNKVLKEHI